jgi:hypothetical protein
MRRKQRLWNTSRQCSCWEVMAQVSHAYRSVLITSALYSCSLELWVSAVALCTIFPLCRSRGYSR